MLLLSWSSFAADVKTLEIGASAPDFSLPGTDGKTYSLKSFANAKVLAIVFTCNHCPTAQAYEDRIISLANDYKAKGVTLIAVSPNDPKAIALDELGYSDMSDSFEEMKIRVKEKGYTFPYLYDGATQKCPELMAQLQLLTYLFLIKAVNFNTLVALMVLKTR